MFRFRKRTFDPDLEQRWLGVECEVYLSGHYAEHLQARGLPVPAWAWLNRPIHARADDLVGLVAGGQPGRGPAWQEARLAVARHLLRRALEGTASLEELQGRLVPLELRLASWEPDQPLDPAALEALALQALEEEAPRST